MTHSSPAFGAPPPDPAPPLTPALGAPALAPASQSGYHPVILPPWGVGTMLLALGLGYGGLPFAVNGFLQWATPNFVPEILFLQVQIATVMGWGLIFWTMAKIYCQNATHPFWEYLGLSSKKPLSSYLWPVVCGLLGLLGILLVLAVVVGQTHIQPQNPYRHLSMDRKQLLAAVAIIIAPVVEELVFRGMIQSTLYKTFGLSAIGRISSILGAALLFSACHFDYQGNLYALASVTLLAIVMGVLRDRFGSIFPGMVVHLANNTLAAAALLVTQGS